MKILDGLFSADQEISFILKQAVLEKYNTLPNYEYIVDFDDKTKRTKFRCHIKIREEHRLCSGSSDFSKNKAKENAIQEGLKILVPDIFRRLNQNQSINLFSTSALTKSEAIQNDGYSSPSHSETSIIMSNEIKKSSSFNEIDTPNGGASDNSRRYSSSGLDFNPPTDHNMNNEDCLIFEGVILRNDFLSKKRRKDSDFNEDDEKSELLAKKLGKDKRHKISSSDCLNNSLFLEEEENLEHIFGDCLKEDVFSNLAIDDPLVVDKYLLTSNFTPLSVSRLFY